MSVLGVNTLDLRIHRGRLNGHEQRSQGCEREQRAWSDTSVHRLTPTYTYCCPEPEIGFRTSEPSHQRRSASNRAYALSKTKIPDSALGRNSRLGRIASRRNLGRMCGSEMKLRTLACTTTRASVMP